MRRDLRLGPEIVRRFLPHRPPFLLVDRIHIFAPGDRLVASKLISSNEPVFQGHFPEFSLWPGVYTLEGLAQATQLMLTFEEACATRSWAELRADLIRHRDQLRRVAPAEFVRDSAGRGVLVGADLRWRRPVFAGDVLEYEISERTESQQVCTVKVEATVGGERVASGRLTVKRV